MHTMSKTLNYSKWDNIEISDDDDDCHPNIDRESWFRMKHRSRVEREERIEDDKKKISNENSMATMRMNEIKKTMERISNKSDNSSDDDELEDKDGLEAELDSLEKANRLRQHKLDEYERNKKWNVDNMCHVVEERTVINPKAKENKFTAKGFALPDTSEAKEDTKKWRENSETETSKVNLTNSISKISTSKTIIGGPDPPIPSFNTKKSDEIAILSYHDFTEKYADLCEDFMVCSTLDKSQKFLIQNGHILLQENACNYLLLAALEDEMNGFRAKMKATARQSQIISNITELASMLKSHPGNVILPFFHRLKEKHHLQEFLNGVNDFVEKLIKRAVVKRQEMDEEKKNHELKEEGNDVTEEAVDLSTIPKEERLGPGGLDPVEVFENLPVTMQKAFESRDTEQLKKALLNMEPKDAEMYMNKCVASGLWNEKKTE